MFRLYERCGSITLTDICTIVSVTLTDICTIVSITLTDICTIVSVYQSITIIMVSWIEYNKVNGEQLL